MIDLLYTCDSGSAFLVQLLLNLLFVATALDGVIVAEGMKNDTGENAFNSDTFYTFGECPRASHHPSTNESPNGRRKEGKEER
jgi:hypothetical protein